MGCNNSSCGASRCPRYQLIKKRHCLTHVEVVLCSGCCFAADAELVGQQKKKKKKKSIPNRPFISSMSNDEEVLDDSPSKPPSAAAAAAAATRRQSITGDSDVVADPVTPSSGLPLAEDPGARSPSSTSGAELVNNVIAGHAEVVQRVRAYLDSTDMPSAAPSLESATSPDAVSSMGSALSSWNTLLSKVPGSAPVSSTDRDLPADALASMAAYDSSDSSSTSSNLRPAEYGMEDTVAAMQAVRSLSIQQESFE